MKIPPNEMPVMMAKLNFLSSSLVGTRENKYIGTWKLIEWTPLKPMQLNWDNLIRKKEIIEQMLMKLSSPLRSFSIIFSENVAENPTFPVAN